MENISKSLLMAAGVLIGVIILTIGVVLFRSFSDFGHGTHEKVEQARIDEWNSNYLKYYGNLGTGQNNLNNSNKFAESIPIPLTSHDVATIANHAKQNNINYEFDISGKSPIKAQDNIYYVQVDIKKSEPREEGFGGNIKKDIINFETDLVNKTEFVKKYSINNIIDGGCQVIETIPIYFKVLEAKVSSITKRVYYVKIQEYNFGDYEKYLRSARKQYVSELK